ncbi:unnamed protein product [Heterosigma akashiwo]
MVHGMLALWSRHAAAARLGERASAELKASAKLWKKVKDGAYKREDLAAAPDLEKALAQVGVVGGGEAEAMVAHNLLRAMLLVYLNLVEVADKENNGVAGQATEKEDLIKKHVEADVSKKKKRGGKVPSSAPAKKGQASPAAANDNKGCNCSMM